MDIKKHVAAVNAEIKELVKLSPADRLETINYLLRCIANLEGAVMAWDIWLHNAALMGRLAPEDLSAKFNAIHELTVKFLRLSVETAEQFNKKSGFESPKPSYVG